MLATGIGRDKGNQLQERRQMHLIDEIKLAVTTAKGMLMPDMTSPKLSSEEKLE